MRRRTIAMVALLLVSPNLGCNSPPVLLPEELTVRVAPGSCGGEPDVELSQVPANCESLALRIEVPRGDAPNYELLVETIGPVAVNGGSLLTADGGARSFRTTWTASDAQRDLPLTITDLSGGSVTVRVRLGGARAETGFRVVPVESELDLCVAEVDCPGVEEPLDVQAGDVLTLRISAPGRADDAATERTLSLTQFGVLALSDAQPVVFDPRRGFDLSRTVRVNGAGYGEIVARVPGFGSGRWTKLAAPADRTIAICPTGAAECIPPSLAVGDRLHVDIVIPLLPAGDGRMVQLSASGSLTALPGDGATVAIPARGDVTIQRTFVVSGTGPGAIIAAVEGTARGRLDVGSVSDTQYTVLEPVFRSLDGLATRNDVRVCSSLTAGAVTVTASDGSVTPSSPVVQPASSGCEAFASELRFVWSGTASTVDLTLLPAGSTVAGAVTLEPVGLVESVSASHARTPWVASSDGMTRTSRVDLLVEATLDDATTAPVAMQALVPMPSPDVTVTPFGTSPLATDLGGAASFQVTAPAAAGDVTLPIGIGGYRVVVVLAPD